MKNTKDRIWAEVSLENIAYNYNAIRGMIPESCRVLAPVKADAYGHGAVPVSRHLAELGADYLAVATLPEAIALREASIGIPILIFGYTAPSLTSELIRHGLTQTVYDADLARAYADEAKAIGKTLKVHLKVDSGMGRLGFSGIDSLIAAMALQNLNFEGIYTHFAVSDERGGGSYTKSQFDTLSNLIRQLEDITRHSFPIRHCANSGAVINCPYTHLDMVRPGIALYGAYGGHTRLPRIFLKPAMALKSRIVQVKEVPAGASVSYGRGYKTKDLRRIAVIAAGYADGLPRNLSGRIDILVAGARVKQVGTICMDMCMIDVTDIPGVAIGDVVTIFGQDRDAVISVNEQSAAANTISYELLSGLSARVPRFYE